MLENTFGLSFFSKNKKGTETENRNIFMRVTVDGHSREVSTKIVWQKSRWSQKARKAMGKKEDVKRINAYLDSLPMKVIQAKQAILDKGKDITADGVKNLLLGKSEEYQMLIEVFKEHNRKMESLAGAEYASGTLVRFETALDHT